MSDKLLDLMFPAKGQARCPRCGGVHGSLASVMGALGTALGLAGATAAGQLMRNTADNRQRTPFSDMRRPVMDRAEARRIIESSNRSHEENQGLMEYIIDKCPNVEVKQWLRGYFNDLVVFELVAMGKFLIEELKKKKEIDRRDIDIIFAAHGEIGSFMLPASCLMPLPSIRDVVLYSPWNCAINADVVYGVATGSIQPQHRGFFCMPQRCPVPDYFHQPTNLPNRWNSMRAAEGSRIPNISVSPLKEPQDPAWNGVVFLQDRFGAPGRNRVLIPFTRQGWMGSFEKIPFLVVTLVLSAVLEAFDCRATIHLAACLSRSEGATLNEDELRRQYEYTIDHTIMGSSEQRNGDIYDALYKAFKDMFR
ncbi:uncharacterized protein [Pagrus major]|uniref:uncharacterized protein isoform X2 n=1 Tax=Pagrus major TaxID=143350 RepID=UPI003CC890B4